MWSVETATDRGKAGPLLLGASIVCIVVSHVFERFGYELCHRGFPLSVLIVVTPLLGAACGLWSVLYRSRGWVTVLKLASAAVNLYQFCLALILLTGIGIVACG